MKYYAVLDTNIIVSFLLFEGDEENTINKLFKHIKKDELIPIYSEEIYEEYRDVLNRSKFNFVPHKIGEVLNLIKDKGIKIKPVHAKEETIDPNDQIFYDAVITKQDDNAYLVTGNLKHFPIRDFIVSAKRMLNIILSRYVYID